MATETTSQTDRKKTITLGLIVSYVWGILAIVLGIWAWSGNPSAGLFFIISGIPVLPPIRRFYQNALHIKLSRWVVIILAVILYGIGAFLYSALPS